MLTARDHRKGTRILAVAVAILAGLTLPAVASGQGITPGDPAVDQYVESLPSAEGDRAPGVGRGRGGAPLPPGVRRQLSRSSEQRLLERLATSSELGAPARGASSAAQDGRASGSRERKAGEGGTGAGGSGGRDRSSSTGDSSPLATVGDLTGAGSPVAIGVLVLAAGIAAAGLFALLRRRRA